MLKIIKGKKIEEISKLNIDKKFERVVVDLGCGDGKKIYNLAKTNPSNFYIGIDSNAAALEDISFKASRKPAKGGLENVVYIEATAENIPLELSGIADEIQINFPWGSLLQGVVSVEENIVKSIASMARKNADLIIYLAYHDKFEGGYIEERKLPELEKLDVRNEILEKYGALGIQADSFEKLNEEEKKELDSSWAKRILEKRNREVYVIKLMIKNQKSSSFAKASKDKEIGNRQSKIENHPDVKRLSYTFYAYGHPNIKATHFKTLEFSKDDFLTERGDCIVGINADYDLKELKKFHKKVKFNLSVIDPKTGENFTSEFKCTVNPVFKSEHELVLRKSFYQSDRTFGHNLNRGANWLDRRIVELMQNPKTRMKVEVIEGWK